MAWVLVELAGLWPVAAQHNRMRRGERFSFDLRWACLYHGATMREPLYRPYAAHELEALAARGGVLGGRLGFAELPRLTGLVEPSEGSVEVTLHFRQQGGEWPVGTIIELEYSTRVRLVCQRCLEPFEEEIKGCTQLAVVETASLIQHLPQDFEPIVLEGERLIPVTLVEDEIMLALPLVPRHPPGDCQAASSDSAAC